MPGSSSGGSSGGTGLPVNSWLANLFSRPSTETAHALDDEFDASSLDVAWTSFAITGAVTVTQQSHRVSLRGNGQITNPSIAGIVKPFGAISAPLSVEAAFEVLSFDTSIPGVGLGFTNGAISTSGIAYNRIYSGGASSGYAQNGGTLANSDTTAGGAVGIQPKSHIAARLYLRAVWKAANTWKMMWSPDGISWTDFGLGTMSHTLTPTHIGLFVSANGGASDVILSVDYIRVFETDRSL